MNRIDYIREFVKLADTMNFSKASEELFISQPSLSRHISVLEAELGIRLVERNTRNVALTPAGAELYQDFVDLLEADERIGEHVKALSPGYCGKVRICSPLYWDAAFIEPMILAFSERCPGVRIDLSVCDPVDGMKRLIRGKADICAGFPSQVRNDVEYKRFAYERLCVTMSVTHPLAQKQGVFLRELVNERFLLPNTDENQAKEQSDVYLLLTKHGIAPSQILFSPNPSAIGLTIRQTGAVSILMNSMGNLRRDYLASVPLEDEDFELPLYLFRRKDNSDESVIAFFDAAECAD